MRKNVLMMLFLTGILMSQSCKKNDTPVLPPNVSEVTVEDENTLKVLFDNTMDNATASIASNYTLDHGYGNPTKAEVNGTEVILTFSTSLKTHTYTLTISDVKSEKGTIIATGSTVSFEYEAPRLWKQATNIHVPQSDDWFFYSLEDDKVVEAGDVSTDKWDFALQPNATGMYIVANETGCGGRPIGTGSGAISLVTKDILEIKTVGDGGEPEPEECSIVASQYFFRFGEMLVVRTEGWCRSLNLYADGGLMEVLPERTILLKTAKGNYAKLQFQGLYKDSPAEPEEDVERFHLTFRFVVQKDGTKNLDIPLDL